MLNKCTGEAQTIEEEIKKARDRILHRVEEKSMLLEKERRHWADMQNRLDPRNTYIGSILSHANGVEVTYNKIQLLMIGFILFWALFRLV